MPLPPMLSRVAQAAGLPARYLYWAGRSGMRYLFTCTGSAGIADFDSGVAIAVSDEKIVWAGEVATLARMPADSQPRRAAIYLHLLASGPDERRAVIEDLRPAARVPLRLAA